MDLMREKLKTEALQNEKQGWTLVLGSDDFLKVTAFNSEFMRFITEELAKNTSFRIVIDYDKETGEAGIAVFSRDPRESLGEDGTGRESQEIL